MRYLLFFLVGYLRFHAAGTFPVRLSGGPNLCAGRVEIFHQGEWGTVCDDEWDSLDVAVVCRELDCGEALSAPHGAWFGEGTGPIWLNEVRCAGTEWQLRSCHHLGFRKHVCTHEEDASAICSVQRFPPFTAIPPRPTVRKKGKEATTTAPPASPAPAEGTPALRLVGGRSHCSGRLEVFHQGQWGTVCDDMWGLPDVAVVCRELGCGEALAAPGSAFFGEGNSVIWLDDVRCEGNESTLTECLTSAWGTHNCRHSEDAGAVCSGEMPLPMVEERLAVLTRTMPPFRPWSTAARRLFRPTHPIRDQAESAAREESWHVTPMDGLSEAVGDGEWQVRLVGGPGSCAGRVEVLYRDQWGTVCDDGWDLVHAAVVCRELDCGAPLLSSGNARFGPGSGPIWLDDVNCTGAESSLRRCRFQPWGQHNCNHHEDASVICTGRWKPLSFPEPTTGTSTIAKQTTSMQDPGPTHEPELQSTLDGDAPPTVAREFSAPLKMELSNLWYHNEPLLPTHATKLELEKQEKLTRPMGVEKAAPDSEILQHVQETESISLPKTRSPLAKLGLELDRPSVETPSLTAISNPDSEKETEATSLSGETLSTVLQGLKTATMVMSSLWPPGLQSTLDVDEPPMVNQEFPATWKMELSNLWYPDEPILTTHATEHELEEQEESIVSWDMEKTAPDSEIRQHVQETESIRGLKATLSTSKLGLEANYPSVESPSPAAMWNPESEKETEPTSPSGEDLSIVAQSLSHVVHTVPPTRWDNMTEVLPVTQDLEDLEATNPSAETQPYSTVGLWELERTMESTVHEGTELLSFLQSVAVTREMEMAATMQTVRPTKQMEATNNPQVLDLKQQEGSKMDTHTRESTVLFPDGLSSWDGEDVHGMPDVPPSPIPNTTSRNRHPGDDVMMSSRKTENGTGTVSTPGVTETAGLNISSAEPVPHSSKLRQSFPGCPSRQEPREEDPNCCCSSPILGNLVHTMEGLHGELGALSTTIHHQGSQLEAVAHGLVELAASVQQLVKRLPALDQLVPAQPSSKTPCRQDEGHMQNQLPLK